MQKEELREIFSRISDTGKSRTILVLGDVMLDQYVDARLLKKRDGAGYLIALADSNDTFAGGAANVACNIAGLTGVPRLVAVIGDDETGARLSDLMHKWRVSTDGIIKDSRWKTPKKVRLLLDGVKSYRVDTEVGQNISEDLTALLIETIRKSIDQISVALVSDYNKGILNNEVMSLLRSECAQRSIPLIVAPKPRVDCSSATFFDVSGVHLFVPNLSEACRMSGCTLIDEITLRKGPLMIDESNISNLMNSLMERFNPVNLMVTLAEHGALFKARNKPLIHISAPTCEPLEVTGAGDTLVAAFATALAVLGTGYQQEALAKFAIYVANHAVRQPNTTVVELLNILSLTR